MAAGDITYKGSSLSLEGDTTNKSISTGITWVTKITADVGAVNGTVKIREGGAAGNVIMDNVALLTAKTQPVLLSFAKPQPIRGLFVETLTNADLIVHVA